MWFSSQVACHLHRKNWSHWKNRRKLLPCWVLPLLRSRTNQTNWTNPIPPPISYSCHDPFSLAHSLPAPRQNQNQNPNPRNLRRNQNPNQNLWGQPFSSRPPRPRMKNQSHSKTSHLTNWKTPPPSSLRLPSSPSLPYLLPPSFFASSSAFFLPLCFCLLFLPLLQLSFSPLLQ